MKKKLVAIFVALVMTMALAACGAGEETTLTGMVVSVDGTVISLMEMDADMDFAGGERPEMPEGMEGFGGFDPGEFDGTLPEGMEPPEGMTMPENGEMPDFGGENGDMRPGFGNFGEDMETTDVDIANAHISVEIDGGKATGSMDDIKAGTFVTITMNAKSEVTNVLVSAQSGFGGGRRPTN